MGKHGQSLAKGLSQHTTHLYFYPHQAGSSLQEQLPQIPAALLLFFLSTMVSFKCRAALDGYSPISPLCPLWVSSVISHPLQANPKGCLQAS